MKKYLLLLCMLGLTTSLSSCLLLAGIDSDSDSETGTVSVDSSSRTEKGTVSVDSSAESSDKNSDDKSDDKEEDNKKDSSDSSEAEIKQKAEQIIYDANNIKVTYKGFSQKGLFQNASFDFLIENNSDKAIQVTSRNVSLNDYTISNFLYEEVGAGKKCNSGVTIYESELELNEIEKIGKVEFNLRFSDPDDWLDDGVLSDKITITLDESVTSKGVPEGSQLAYEKDGVSVYYVKNDTGSWLAEEALKFYIENNTDKNVTVVADEVNVNDYTIDFALFSAEIAANKKCMETLDITKSDLEKNDITEIEKVDFKLRCYDTEDYYPNLWESDTITINMK
ncbi:MAG: hypothetical protein IJN05_10915 [Ruminococcus sp.]|nr:hypothetical protein [Ruminococcus sp.]